MLEAEQIRARIAAALPGAEVEVKDLTGTGDHFEARVVCADFAGKALREQHRAVYAALDELLGSGALHALAVRTFTPDQWRRTAGR